MPDFAPGIIILFVLLGACAAIGVGYAMARLYTSPEDFNANTFRAPLDEQMEYMRNVRARNQDVLWEDAKALHREGRMKRPPREVSIQES